MKVLINLGLLTGLNRPEYKLYFAFFQKHRSENKQHRRVDRDNFESVSGRFQDLKVEVNVCNSELRSSFGVAC